MSTKWKVIDAIPTGPQIIFPLILAPEKKEDGDGFWTDKNYRK